MPHIVRFPREDGGIVLVHVSHRGPQELDLDLKGTENTSPYFTSIYQEKLSELKSKTENFDVSSWQRAVAWALLRKAPEAEHEEVTKNLEVIAAIDERQGMVLKFRQDLGSGLKPFVGSIILSVDEDLELDLFEWAGLSTELAHKKQQEGEQLSKELATLNSLVKNRETQLDELVRVKGEEEDKLLEKFRQLLNTKKLKIRDQQRLLAGANVNAEAARRVQEARKSRSSGQGTSSRLSKRKAGEQINEEGNEQRQGAESATESDDPFDAVNSPSRDGSEEEEENFPPRRELPFSNKPPSSRETEPDNKERNSNDVAMKEPDIDNEETDDEL